MQTNQPTQAVEQEEKRLNRFVRDLLEKHLFDVEQEGYGAFWYELKNELPGYKEVTPFVESIITLAMGMKEAGILDGFKKSQSQAILAERSRVIDRVTEWMRIENDVSIVHKEQWDAFIKNLKEA